MKKSKVFFNIARGILVFFIVMFIVLIYNPYVTFPLWLNEFLRTIFPGNFGYHHFLFLVGVGSLILGFIFRAIEKKETE